MEETHYNKVAKHYGELMFDTQYFETLADKIIHLGQINEKHLKVADIGSGPGILTQMIYEKAKLLEKITCIEPSEEMTVELHKKSGLRPICTDVNQFSMDEERFDRIIIICAVHHFKSEESLFERLHKKIDDGGKILIASRPETCPYYPWGDAAHKAWWKMCKGQIYPVPLMLLKVGFKDVQSKYELYQHEMSTKRWCEMIRGRVFSNLSRLTDQEIEDMVTQLQEQYQSKVLLPDPMFFITANK